MSRLANVLIFADGALPVDGKFAPGVLPCATSTRFAAVAKAFAKPVAFVELAPNVPSEAANCASAQLKATVVTSLTMKAVVVLVERLLQAPRAAARPIDVLSLPEPIWPPLATR